MHIPSEMLGGAMCPVTAAISAVGVGLAAVAAARTEHKPAPSYFAAIVALIFAAQMLNFPVAGGTSGHLLGGMLAVAVLGLPWGVLAMALVLAVQALLFSDGGVLQLGANVLNMALLGGGAMGWLWQRAQRRLPAANPQGLLMLAAWSSTLLAALACSIELSLAGAARFTTIAPAMLGVHALIGIGEALATVALVSVLRRLAPASGRQTAALPLGLTLVLLMLSPLASVAPDGLEWVATQHGLLKASAPLFVSPLADYALPAVANAALSTVLAGLGGVLALFGLAWTSARLLGAERH